MLLKPTKAVVVARRYTQGISYPILQQYELTVVPFKRGGAHCYKNAIKAAGYDPAGLHNGSWGVRSGQNWTTGYVFPISPKKTPKQVIRFLKKSHKNGNDSVSGGIRYAEFDAGGVKFIVNPEVKAKPVVEKPKRAPKPLPPIGTRRYACRAHQSSTSGGHWYASVQVFQVVRFKRSKRVGWRKGALQNAPGYHATRGLALEAARAMVQRITGMTPEQHQGIKLAALGARKATAPLTCKVNDVDFTCVNGVWMNLATHQRASDRVVREINFILNGNLPCIPSSGAPWFVGMRNGYNADTIYARDGKDVHSDSAICRVFNVSQNHTVAESAKGGDKGLKHAFLLAAAPEMKQALRDAENALQRMVSTPGQDRTVAAYALQSVRAALDKASDKTGQYVGSQNKIDRYTTFGQ